MKNNICLVGNSFIDEIIEVHNIKKNLSNIIDSRKKCFGGIFNNLSAINIKNFNKIYLITEIPNLFLENKYYLKIKTAQKIKNLNNLKNHIQYSVNR